MRPFINNTPALAHGVAMTPKPKPMQQNPMQQNPMQQNAYGGGQQNVSKLPKSKQQEMLRQLQSSLGVSNNPNQNDRI